MGIAITGTSNAYPPQCLVSSYSRDERRVASTLELHAAGLRGSRKNSLHRRISTPHASSSRIIARNHSNDATAHSSARSGGSVRVNGCKTLLRAGFDVVPRSYKIRPPPRARARIVHTLRRARAPPTCRSRPRRRRPLRSARIASETPSPSPFVRARARTRPRRRVTAPERDDDVPREDDTRRHAFAFIVRAELWPSRRSRRRLPPRRSASTRLNRQRHIDADTTWRRRAPRTRPKTCARTRCSTMTITSTPWRPSSNKTDVVVDVFVQIAQGPEDRHRDRRLHSREARPAPT